MSEQTTQLRTQRTVTRLLLVAVAMFAFGFALVPMYQVICEITGFNGFVSGNAAQAPVSAGSNTDRTVTVEFVATVNESRPWTFRPRQTRMEVKPGELYTAYFYAENMRDRDTVSQIVPSVAPGTAGRHFHKTECFCFTEQAFEGGQGREMPVTFYVDPALPERTTTLTLSYTLFDLGDGDVPEFDENAARLHSSAR
ncbi:MAG: cytochrome c oxidase assembly protein [Aquisalimonadaceae bacterium]